MVNRATAANWMLVVPALPPALVIFLALVGPHVLDYVTASNPDPYLRDRELSNLSFTVVAISWVFSVAVGCAVLLIDGVLIVTGFASLRQWRVWASVILAAVDTFLPIGVLVLFIIVARGLLRML